MELEIDCLTLRRLLKKVCSYKCQSSMLVSQVHIMAGQNVKKKYLMCQIPIKMLKQHAIPNSSLHNLKIYSSKGCRKTSQRLIICMYLATHSSSKYSNFQQKISLQIMGFCFDWWILLLLTLTSITQFVTKYWCQGLFKNFVHYFTLANHMYITDWLI